MTTTLGASLVSLFANPDRAKRYKHLLRSNIVKGLDEYRLIEALAEFNATTNEFVAGEFETFAQVKLGITQDQADIVLEPHLEFVRNPISLTDAGEQSIIDTLTMQSAISEITADLESYKASSDPAEAIRKIRARVEEVQNELVRRQQASEVEPNIEELLDFDQNDDGLVFPPAFEGLNDCMRPLQPGDFGIIAARPDAGKTSLIGNFVTHWAAQLPDDVPVVWINNEGPGNRIWLRLYQIALGATLDELQEYRKAGLLEKRFVEATRGGRAKIKVYDAHGLDTIAIEDIIKKEKPGVTVYDMIDNVKFSGVANHGGQRTDQILETMYQWARNLSVQHGHLGIASSQISADGEGMQWPLMSMLKDSKTGKQGASDFIMMMGSTPEQPEHRYISLPKNKMARKRRDPRSELLFDGRRGKFYNQFVSEIERKSMALAGLAE